MQLLLPDLGYGWVGNIWYGWATLGILAFVIIVLMIRLLDSNMYEFQHFVQRFRCE